MPFLVFAIVAVAVFWFAKSKEAADSPEEDPAEEDPLPTNSGSTGTAYIDGIATEIPLTDIGNGMSLRTDAAAAFVAMSDALNGALQKTLTVNSAFRTMEQQQHLRDTLGAVAARPGYSNHQNGIAIDVNFINPSKPGYDQALDEWLLANAEQYGWKRTGLNFTNQEPWHLDFVGS